MSQSQCLGLALVLGGVFAASCLPDAGQDAGTAAEDRAGVGESDAATAPPDASTPPEDAGDPTRDWLCDLERYGADDGCDCGCGIHDPDCDGADCTVPTCVPPEGSVCQRCHDFEGRQMGCHPCDRCLINACDSEVVACYSRDTCSVLFECLCGETAACATGCTGDSACEEACRSDADPEDVARADALFDCIEESCATFCTGQ